MKIRKHTEAHLDLLNDHPCRFANDTLLISLRTLANISLPYNISRCTSHCRKNNTSSKIHLKDPANPAQEREHERHSRCHHGLNPRDWCNSREIQLPQTDLIQCYFCSRGPRFVLVSLFFAVLTQEILTKKKKRYIPPDCDTQTV